MVEKTRGSLSKPKSSGHHSYSDWSFSNDKWGIVTDQYVSTPSSIRWLGAVENAYQCQVCKHTEAYKIPQGSLITYWRQHDELDPWEMMFRNTAELYLANRENCYVAQIDGNVDRWYLNERNDDAVNRTWWANKTFQSLNTWYRFRLSWWESWGIMSVRLDVQVDGEWVQQGDLITVPDAIYGEQAVQRVGLSTYQVLAQRPTYFDNTQIWRAP